MRKLFVAIFAFLAINSFAQDNKYWTQFAAESFESGSGTYEDPYIIKTAEQLAKLSADLVANDINYEDTYFRLDADIDLKDHIWFAIGNEFVDGSNVIKRRFAGVFDGNNHKILNINGDYGLFGYTSALTEIRNVVIASGELTGNNMVGSVVGSNLGLVENCVNYANVSAAVSYPGGIVGGNMRGEDGSLSGVVRNCYNYGSVSSREDYNNGMGSAGIAGSNTSVIEFCANYGPVTSKTSQAAGIVATLDGGFVMNCYNMGSVESKEQGAGCVSALLARTTDTYLYAVYNAGKVTSNSDDNGSMAGSVVCVYMPMGGSFDSSIRNVYNDSDVCSDLKVIRDAAFGNVDKATCLDKTTAEMKSADFVAILNEAGETDLWTINENFNDGYPSFGEPIYVGIDDVAEDLNYVGIYGTEGFIKVTGAENGIVTVYDLSGCVVAKGSAAEISSINFDGGIYIVNVNVDGKFKSTKVAL